MKPSKLFAHFTRPSSTRVSSSKTSRGMNRRPAVISPSIASQRELWMSRGISRLTVTMLLVSMA
jgi:hypothetical protein